MPSNKYGKILPPLDGFGRFPFFAFVIVGAGGPDLSCLRGLNRCLQPLDRDDKDSSEKFEELANERCFLGLLAFCSDRHVLLLLAAGVDLSRTGHMKQTG